MNISTIIMHIYPYLRPKITEVFTTYNTQYDNKVNNGNNSTYDSLDDTVGEKTKGARYTGGKSYIGWKIYFIISHNRHPSNQHILSELSNLLFSVSKH